MSRKKWRNWKRKEKNSNILNVKDNIYECGWCSDEKVKLLIPMDIYSVWCFLLMKYSDKEWCGVYDVVDGKVENFRIPKQEISTAECELLEEIGGIGVIHSHHEMGSFHSGQDDKHCRNLYNFSLVISHDGIIGSERVSLPCGGRGYKQLEIVIEGIDVDTSAIQEASVISSYNNEGYSQYDLDANETGDDKKSTEKNNNRDDKDWKDWSKCELCDKSDCVGCEEFEKMTK